MARLWLALACLAQVGSLSLAAIHGYDGQLFTRITTSSNDVARVFRGGREGLFASTDKAPSSIHHISKLVSDGQSYIKLRDLQFERPASMAHKYRELDGDNSPVQVIIFELQDRDLIGHEDTTGTRRFCCTNDLAAKIRCQPGQLIVKDHADGKRATPWVQSVHFHGNDTVAHAAQNLLLPIHETGMYHLWFATCDNELSGVRVHGSTSWKNPHGYLPGMMSAFLYFYGYMALTMLALALVWLSFYALNWADVIPLQHCITVVIALGMLEMSTWYFDFVNFNTSGFRPYAATVWAILFGALRKSLSRMLMLVVSMGYGVVRPTLGGYSKQVWVLGVLYIVAACTKDMVIHVGTIDDLSSLVRALLVIPVAMLDAVFLLWIFTSLSRTLTQLGARRQEVKLTLYRNFTNLLAIALWVSVGWMAYEMWLKVSDHEHTEKWQLYWVTDAFWQGLSFSILAIICLLWRPSKNSQCYAYTEADDDIDMEHLTSRAAAEVNTDVFSIDDEPDEESKLA